eukprot:4752003-Karenia_brevis.AAC.1
MFEEKFENAFAASKWVEKVKKQRTTESPVASPAADAEEKSKKEKRTGSNGKTYDVDLTPEEEDDLDERE